VTLHAGARYRFEATGSGGTLAIDGSLYGGALRGGQVGDAGLADLAGSRRAPRSGALPADGKRSLAAARHLALQLEDWLPAFDGRPAPQVPTLRDGLRVQRMISAARRSSAGEGWVTL
jgi:predicted dehydrogenase